VRGIEPQEHSTAGELQLYDDFFTAIHAFAILAENLPSSFRF